MDIKGMILRVLLKTAATVALGPLSGQMVSEGVDRLTEWLEDKSNPAQKALEEKLSNLLSDPFYNDKRKELQIELTQISKKNPPPLECHSQKKSDQKQAYSDWVDEVTTENGHLRNLFIACQDEMISFCWENGDYWKKFTLDHEKRISTVEKRQDNHEERISDLENGSHPPKEQAEEKTNVYQARWKEPLFLNNPKRKEKNIVKILQSELYVPPMCQDGEDEEDATALLLEQAETGDSGFLILGQPGMGKSTLVTWFLNHYQGRTVRVFRFSDWYGKEDTLSKAELQGSILILDGFDEVNLSAEEREKYLRGFYGKFHHLNLTIFVTCRVGYLDTQNLDEVEFITLKNLNESQIDTFSNCYAAKSGVEVSQKTRDMAKKNLDVFGVPLIYYMTLALGIDMAGAESVSDVYDRIFNVENGIYNRCVVDNEERKKSYDREAEAQSPTQKQREALHQMTRDIAFEVFEHNPEGETITKETYQRILEMHAGNDKETRRLLNDYFKSIHHSESNPYELRLKHRTIYEYFVVEGFLEGAKKCETAEGLARWMSEYWKIGKLTENIEEYLQRKINQLEKKREQYQLWEKAAGLIAQKGVYLCSEKAIEYESIMDLRHMDAWCFANVVFLLQVLFNICGYDRKKEYLFTSQPELKPALVSAIRHAKEEDVGRNLRKLDLSGANLSRKNLSGVSFADANLCGAYLRRADLSDANLSSADLSGADLRGAYLHDANLCGANLCDAYLRDANLRDANLRDTNLLYVDLRGADLSDANLRGADLRGAFLSGAELRGANLSDAFLSGATLPDGFISDDQEEKWLISNH